MKYDFENAPCGYISFYPDGRIQDVNQTFLKWTGYRKEEVAGSKKIQDLTVRGTTLYIQMFVYPLLKMQGFVNEISVNILALDGTVKECLFNASAIKQADGNIAQIHAILFSIADRKKYETEILNAKKAAEAAAEHKEHILQVQRRIMSILGHDTRAPLFSINRIMKLAADGLISPQEMFPNFALMANQLDATLILINDLLSWSKAHFSEKKWQQASFSLQSVTDAVFDLLKSNAIAKELYLKNDIDPHITMHSNQSMVTFIVRNLVNNAIKFTSKGGVTVSALAGGDAVCITVRDTGIGMAPEQLEQFSFGALDSSDGTANEKGSGMGMVLIKEFLLQLGGTLRADSEPGKGTTVIITLPSLPVGDESKNRELHAGANNQKLQPTVY